MQLHQAVDRQATAGEERERHREFGDDERAADELPAGSGGGTAAVLEHLADVCSRRRQAGAQPNTRPRTETRIVNTMTCGFNVRSALYGSVSCGMIATILRAHNTDGVRCRAATVSDRTRLSEQQLTEQPRLAPMLRGAHREFALRAAVPRPASGFGDQVDRTRIQQHEADGAEEQERRCRVSRGRKLCLSGST